MGFTNSLMWGLVALVIGGSVGVGASKLVNSYSKKQERKKVVDFLEEKTENNLKLDGEIINVRKFIYKQNDEVIIKVEIADMVKKDKIKGLKQEKTPFMGGIIQKVFPFLSKEKRINEK